jgi:hypothetical protein
VRLTCSLFPHTFLVCRAGVQRLIALFIQLPGSTTLEGLDFAGSFVYQIMDDINAKFNRLKLGDDGTGRTPLLPTQTLSEAGIVLGTKLVVELTAVITAGLIGKWGKIHPSSLRHGFSSRYS